MVVRNILRDSGVCEVSDFLPRLAFSQTRTIEFRGEARPPLFDHQFCELAHWLRSRIFVTISATKAARLSEDSQVQLGNFLAKFQAAGAGYRASALRTRSKISEHETMACSCQSNSLVWQSRLSASQVWEDYPSFA